MSDPITPEYLDGLVDTDPLRLKNEAIYLLATVERLRAELATAQQDAAKWGRVEFEIARRADHGDLDAQDLLATAHGEQS